MLNPGSLAGLATTPRPGHPALTTTASISPGAAILGKCRGFACALGNLKFVAEIIF